MRIYTKIGDVFLVVIDDKTKKYFQYIERDLTQLNSDVIRVFKAVYPIIDNPDLFEIVGGEVDFYAHCITKLGLKMKYWEKVGNIKDVGNVENILFMSSGDNPQTKISNNWWVWKINEEQKHVEKMEGENRNAEIGSVIPPDSIVHRMRTGKFDFVYPEFE
ncbi:MAG: hypothetical protein JXR36_07050 [Bacteroidales bacterium]|nr:hypothetical protein [Bacteroidales bacterium]